MKRLYNLDYLRGMAAFSIMIYHYLSFTLGQFASNTFFGRIGIYGVSIFYVLSGLTLYYVYYKSMKPDFTNLKDFYIKRFFRIFPLLWLTIILTLIINWQMPDKTTLFLNFTGLFGLLRCNGYIGGGVWSIGNELVFYLAFPIFVYFSKRSKIFFSIISFLLFLIFIQFAFAILKPSEDLSSQWKLYINPLNQIFLFLGGFLIGLIFENRSISFTMNLILLTAAILLFIMLPMGDGNTITIVTGFNRLIFTVICFTICLCFFKLNYQLPAFINKPLTMLGEASYSIYLLHPIIFILTGFLSGFCSKHFFYIHEYYRFSASVILSLVIGNFIYHRYERYFMKKSHYFTNLSFPSFAYSNFKSLILNK